jgi:hypothetical protein
MGLNSECPTGKSCFNSPGICAAQTSATVTQPTNYYPQVSIANNFCGLSYTELNCTQPCPNGLQSECLTENYTCFNNPSLCTNNKVCGINNSSLTCDQTCPSGFDTQCRYGLLCFSTNTTCDSQSNTTPSSLFGNTGDPKLLVSSAKIQNENLILFFISLFFIALNTLN